MRLSATILIAIGLLSTGSLYAQSTEFVFSPESTGDLSDPLGSNVQNGVRGLSGPYDLDRDGNLEVLLAQHTAGGRVHVIENVGPDTWELVYSTPVIDSTNSSLNARYAVGADVDGDGNWEIVYVAGNSYNTDLNPLAAVGAYIWEHDGVEGSDNYGTEPAFIANYYGRDGYDAPGTARAEHMEAFDVDGDGRSELLIPSNGASAVDICYVIGIVGDIEPNGYATSFATVNIEGRLGPRENGNAFGGGSPNAVAYGDFNGDGATDISWMVWNNFNVMNMTVAGTDSVVAADTLADERFVRASLTLEGSPDHVALFDGRGGDIDGDGNDEVVWVNFFTNNASILNYDAGEDPLVVNIDNLNFETLALGASGGTDIADLDGDGFNEIIVGGPGYSAADFNAGIPPTFLVVAEFKGGDVGDGNNYSVQAIATPSDADAYAFNTINRDSAGVVETYYETACSKEGTFCNLNDPIFPSGVVAAGDADGDGSQEVALAFQGVDDSLDTILEFWDGDSLQQAFSVPDGGTDPGPALSGDSFTFSFAAEPGSFFNFATMFGESNDLFFAAADTGIALFNEDGTMRSGDVTSEIWLWDAGTELNEEPFVGPNQAPRQAEPNTGEADTLGGVTLCCDHDPWDYPAPSDVMTVNLEADEASGMFTVTITNVSQPSALGKTAAVVPLSPGVAAQDAAGTGAIFTEGGAASAGLEQLAEDGSNLALAAELEAERGYFRMLTGRVAADVRSFLRIISMDGTSVKAENKIVLPTDYELSANYPNPFNPITTFDFTLPIDKEVSVKIYDITGRLVNTLIDDELRTAGKHTITWDARDVTGQSVASGSYLYTLEYGNFRQTRTMVLLK